MCACVLSRAGNPYGRYDEESDDLERGPPIGVAQAGGRGRVGRIALPFMRASNGVSVVHEHAARPVQDLDDAYDEASSQYEQTRARPGGLVFWPVGVAPRVGEWQFLRNDMVRQSDSMDRVVYRERYGEFGDVTLIARPVTATARFRLRVCELLFGRGRIVENFTWTPPD